MINLYDQPYPKLEHPSEPLERVGVHNVEHILNTLHMLLVSNSGNTQIGD